MKNILYNMKLMFLRKYFDLILLSDSNLTASERIEYYIKSIITFAPIAYLLDMWDLWFEDNKLFFSSVLFFIFFNMILGMHRHFKNKTFNWFTLIKKTMTMVIAVLITYFILEIILKVAGHNVITDSFRAALQVATLLYPGSKILKNVFILTNGEHPPQWVMEKIYNFQTSGNLSKFIETKKEQSSQTEEI